MSGKFVTRCFWAALPKFQFEEKYIFGKETKQGEAANCVDLQDYSDRLRKIYEELDDLNYDVINVVPIAMGQTEDIHSQNNSFLGNRDYSITRGAVVIGKKRV